MTFVRAALAALYGLVVDDGFVAAGALLAIVTAFVLSRDSVLGPSVVVGFTLLALCAGSLAWSLVRSARTGRSAPTNRREP
jgi:hypothetical protein